MTLWLSWAKRNQAPVSGGVWATGYAKKLVVHTTESDTFTPGGTYFGHHGWPHLTNERDGTLWQHMDLDAPARALKNVSGGVETNKGGAWQIENVARAVHGDNALTDRQIATLRRLVAELRDKRGLQMVALPAGAIPGSARPDAPQRMTRDQWRSFGGICGHRHVPENDHWDPGAFDLRRLLIAAKPPEEDDDMLALVKVPDSPGAPNKVYAVDGLTARWIGDPATLDAYIKAGLCKPLSAASVLSWRQLTDAITVVEQ